MLQKLRFGNVLSTIFDYMPCFAISILFRLGSIAVIWAYLDIWVFLCIGIYVFLVLLYLHLIPYRRECDILKYEHSFLVLFCVVFMPVVSFGNFLFI